MWISRKLDEIHQELDLLVGKGKVVGFLANTETAQKIGGLVEDIREVMMDYQVRVLTHSLLSPFLTNVPDFVATRYLRHDLSAHCGSHHPTILIFVANR